MLTETERILQYWQIRRCWICGQAGYCDHRELAVAQAEIEREDLRAARRNRPVIPLRRQPHAS